MLHSKNRGLDGILDDIATRCEAPRTIEGIIHAIVTYDGRQSLRIGQQSLSPAEKMLLERFGDAILDTSTRPEPRFGLPETGLYVGFWSFGRSFIGLRSSTIDPLAGQSARHLRILGVLPLLDEQADALTLPLPDFRESQAFMAACDAAKRREVILTVKDGIDHMDPICLHVHERTFTNTVRFNNLLIRGNTKKKGFFLDDLLEDIDRPLTPIEQEFLYCFYVVRMGGFRGEEFNGRQLTIAAVRRYLDAKLDELTTLAGRRTELPEATLEKAARCKQLKAEIRPDYFTYRQVHGISLCKTEGYHRRSYLCLDAEAIPEPITSGIEQRLGVKVGPGQQLDAYFTDVVEQMASCMDEHTPEGLNPYEELLELVTRTTMTEVGAQVGLTRCMRNLHWMQRALVEGRHDEICAASMPDEYFCAVFLTDDTTEMLSTEPGYDVKLNIAIARRMEYNGWHYMPGHFAEPLTSGARHFYAPPRPSDFALWSDQRHPGHVRFRVRFSIRSPAGLNLLGRKYHGMLDMRLMRLYQRPLGLEDMLLARQRVAYLRALHQAVADYSMRHDRPLKIEAFNAGRAPHSRDDQPIVSRAVP